MPTPTQRILGIDPGLNRTGYGVIDRAGPQLRFVAAGVLRVPPGALPERLGFILRELQAVIAEFRPTAACVEKVFVNVNPQSTLLLGQARGAAICAAVSADVAVVEFSALQIKQAVVGYGKADKRQIQMMVTHLLDLARAPSADAADALAAAICHAHASPLAARLSQAGGAALPTAAAVAATGRSTRGRKSRAAWREFAAATGRVVER